MPSFGIMWLQIELQICGQQIQDFCIFSLLCGTRSLKYTGHKNILNDKEAKKMYSSKRF